MNPPHPRPLPDADSAPFWAAVREGRLVVQRCTACGTYRFPPTAVCRRCRSTGTTWAEVSGQARVLSWIVTHQVFHPAFAGAAPYAVLLVELAEQPGLAMYGNLRPPDAPITEGMAVRAVFEAVDDELTLVQWTPSDG